MAPLAKKVPDPWVSGTLFIERLPSVQKRLENKMKGHHN